MLGSSRKFTSLVWPCSSGSFRVVRVEISLGRIVPTSLKPGFEFFRRGRRSCKLRATHLKNEGLLFGLTRLACDGFGLLRLCGLGLPRCAVTNRGMVGKVLEPKGPNLLPDLFPRRVAMLVEGLEITKDTYEFVACHTECIGVHDLREPPHRTQRPRILHRYDFPPQDHAIDRALAVHDPKTKKGAGELVAIDEVARTVDLKRGLSSAVRHPGALVPYDFIGSEVKQESLQRLGTWVGQNGIAAEGPFRAARDLLLRRRPKALKIPTESPVKEGQLTKESRELVASLSRCPAFTSSTIMRAPPKSATR